MSAPRIAFQDAAVTLWQGDNREVLPTLEAGSVDLIFTSPPYNLGTTTGGGFPGGLRRNDRGEPMGKTNLWRGGQSVTLAEGKWGRSSTSLGPGAYECFDDALPTEVYLAQQRAFLRECWRLLSERGAIFYNHKPRIQAGVVQLPTYFLDGLPLRQVIVWRRPGGMNFNETYYVPSHEWLLLIAKPGFRLKRGKSGAGLTDVWDVLPERDNPHPAPFPIDLPRRALGSIASGVDVVLDPFAGSGTALRAAKDFGIKSVGIELNPTYCEWAARWLAQAVLDVPTETHTALSLELTA
jgi:site-specific DNA-methyltransferase (adenine-specific)